MAKIDRLSLYVINRIKFYRLVAGMSARKLSEVISKSEAYVGLCEGAATDQKYNSADYPLLAEIFNCSISDILPPNDWPRSSSHEKVEKSVKSLSDRDFVAQILLEIEASGDANILLDEKVLLKHLNVVNEQEKEIVRSVLNKIEK